MPLASPRGRRMRSISEMANAPTIAVAKKDDRPSSSRAKTPKRLSPKEEMVRRVENIEKYRKQIQENLTRASASPVQKAPTQDYALQKSISVPIKIGRFTIEDVIEDPHTQSLTVTYRGGSHVVHTGSRGGRYILVNNKKVYLHNKR